MQRVILLLLFMGISLDIANAAVDYQALKAGYENERGAMLKEYADKAAALADRYAKSLQDLQKALNERGDTNAALTVAAEIERFGKERKVYQEVSEATLLVLRNVEKANEQEIARLKTEQTRISKENSQSESAGDGKATATSSEEPSGAAKLQSCAVGATVTVSSTHFGESGESTASALVDGNLFTRWSSDYSEPQNVVIQLKKPAILSKLRLHCEKASATKYCVYLSSDGKNWISMYLYMNTGSGEPVSRIDDVDLKNTLASWIKLDLQSCINKQWGFSLYEIEALGNDAVGDARRKE
jgi:hypothetical protein